METVIKETEMKYYLDCEFDGMGGPLLSLALVPEGQSAPLYLVRMDVPDISDDWVQENVMSIRWAGWKSVKYGQHMGIRGWPKAIEDYLRGDDDITVVTDWPDDIRYFCDLILTGPGEMIELRPAIKFEMHRVDAWPTTMPEDEAVQHNALWDAYALRHKLAA